jgi:hypothetical protein
MLCTHYFLIIKKPVNFQGLKFFKQKHITYFISSPLLNEGHPMPTWGIIIMLIMGVGHTLTTRFYESKTLISCLQLFHSLSMEKYIRRAPYYIHENPCSKPRDLTYNIALILRSDGRIPILANPWTRCSQNWLILRCLSKDYVFPLSRLQCVFASGHSWRVVVAQERSFQFKNNERN